MENKDVKVGDYYYYRGDLCKVISVDTYYPLYEFDKKGDAGALSHAEMVNFYKRRHKGFDATYLLNTNKFYHQNSIRSASIKPAYKKVKSTKLSRKVYPNPFKVEGDYLYVKF